MEEQGGGIGGRGQGAGKLLKFIKKVELYVCSWVKELLCAV